MKIRSGLTSVYYGNCAKQIVKAVIIAKNQEVFTGINVCENPQEECPRKDMKSEEGYHLCKEICKQISHAEVAALKAAGSHAKGAILILSGHTYCCDDCITKMKTAGIKEVIII